MEFWNLWYPSAWAECDKTSESPLDGITVDDDQEHLVKRYSRLPLRDKR